MVAKIDTPNAPAVIGAYSQATVYNNIIYVSGQLPIKPNSKELVEGDSQFLTKQILDNIEAILKAAGSDLYHVARTEVFLIDLDRDFAGMNKEFERRFNPQCFPARQTIGVAKLPKNASIEISCIATVCEDFFNKAAVSENHLKKSNL